MINDLPPGAIHITTEDAIKAILTGDHPEVGMASREFDEALVLSLRTDPTVQCIRLADGRIGFSKEV